MIDQKMTDLLKDQSIFIQEMELLAHLRYMGKILKAQKELKFRLDLGIKAI